ncbi:MAG: ABC transporter ATP-binding protein [Mariniblastus sp.]
MTDVKKPIDKNPPLSAKIPLSLINLEKSFGQTEVLKGVTLELDPGSITGLLGRNGSGKTTLIRTAVGLLKPENGQANLFGYSAWDSPAIIRRRVGYVSQKFDDMVWLKVKDAIALVGSFYESWDSQLVERFRSEWNVDNNKKIYQLSQGQQQKVGILLATGYRPDLLVLDEPVASLDPAARQEFLRALLMLNDEIGQTILFSSHITTDIERVAADVAILNEGKITYHGALDELKEKVKCVFLRADALVDDLTKLDGYISSRVDGNRLQVWVEDWTDQKQESLNEMLGQQQGETALATVVAESVGLDELFMGMTS